MAGSFGGRGWEEGRVPRTSLIGLMPSLSLIYSTIDRSEANRREESTDQQSRSKKGQRAREGMGEARRLGRGAEHQRTPGLVEGQLVRPHPHNANPMFVPTKHNKMIRTLWGWTCHCAVDTAAGVGTAGKQLTISSAWSPWNYFMKRPQTHAVCTRKRLQQPRADQCLLSHAGCKGWLAGVASDEPENGQTREAKCR